MRIVLKPSRPVRVRVNDAAGLPVPGAAVEAIDYAFSDPRHDRPRWDSRPSRAGRRQDPWVIGLKAGAGFDYFENYRTTPAIARFTFRPCRRDLTLTLDGAQTAENQGGRPDGPAGSGRRDRPVPTHESRQDLAIAYLSTARRRVQRPTRQGIATFDWLPKEASREYPLRGFTFIVDRPRTSPPGMIRY